MKKKRLAAVAVALVIIVSCGFSAFALPALGIGDVISIIDGVDLGTFPSYNETGWNELSLDDRRTVLNNAISSFGGSSYVDDDFLNSSQAYDYYCYLIRSGNSIDFLTAPATTMFGELMLERAGQADFGLGFYKGGSHSSGKFGDGTVADTLNDEFLDYLPNNNYSSGGSFYYFLSDGSYCIVSPFNFQGAANIAVDVSTSETTLWQYYVVVDKYSADGVFLERWFDDCFATISQTGYRVRPFAADGSAPFWDFTVIDSTTGAFRFMRYGYHLQVIPSDVFYCPLLVDYSYTYDPSVINCVAYDDNGNEINLDLNSDGVTYEGDTYNYNDDNSVTINGDTYYITVDPSKVDEDYYKQFLQTVINNYYNYYTSSPTEFDDTDIIKSLKSIFDSLERLRNDFYSYIRQIYTTVHDGFNNMRSSLSNISKKLDTIIKQLKDINKGLGELTEEQEQENLLSWLDLIEKFKKKVGWSSLSQSVTNISTAFFGERVFTRAESGDISVDIVTKNTRQSSSMPSLCIEFMGVQYDLFSCVGSLGSEIETIKSFISLFLWVGFILSVYRSIPSIIGGVSAFEEQQNKRGA